MDNLLDPTFLGYPFLLKMEFALWPSKNHQNHRFFLGSFPFLEFFFYEYFSFLNWHVSTTHFFLKVICEKSMSFCFTL